jgi:RNA polymerase sigma-70 factor (ECF subfamily)
MKPTDRAGHSPADVTALVDTQPAPAARPASVADVYAAHADFVWASLQRLGARDDDLNDLLQEVFLVVHQRLRDFEGRSTLTTWLYGICIRVVASHRRRLGRRRETTVDAAETPAREPVAATASPEEAAAIREARVRLAEILDEMDLEKRAVLVMYDVEEMACDQIAAIVGVPVGTVYSRLHAARAQFEKLRTVGARALARGAR